MTLDGVDLGIDFEIREGGPAIGSPHLHQLFTAMIQCTWRTPIQMRRF